MWRFLHMDKEVKILTINKNNSEEMRGLFEVYKKSILEDYLEYSRLTKEYLAREDKINEFVKNAGIILGAFIERKLVGYLIARKVWGGVGYCEALGVLNEYQRKGIGTILLEKIEEYARKEGVHSIHLETYDRDLEYYKKREYKEYGFDKNSYFGADAYLMKKEIQEPKEKNYLKY